MTGITFQHHDATEARAMLEELTGLYLEVNTEQPHGDAPIFSRERFLERTLHQLEAPGFELVTARDDGELVGFAFGFTMRPGRWWQDAEPSPPKEILSATKFAVIEFMLRGEHRGHGHGHRLFDELLSGRPETYATLAAEPDAPVYAMYLHWGWTKIGEFHDEDPFMDALILSLGDS